MRSFLTSHHPKCLDSVWVPGCHKFRIKAFPMDPLLSCHRAHAGPKGQWYALVSQGTQHHCAWQPQAVLCRDNAPHTSLGFSHPKI